MLTLLSPAGLTSLAMDSAEYEAADGVCGVTDDCLTSDDALSLSKGMPAFSSLLQVAIDTDSNDSQATETLAAPIDDDQPPAPNETLSEIESKGDSDRVTAGSDLFHQSHESVAILASVIYQADPENVELSIQAVSKEGTSGTLSRFVPDASFNRQPAPSMPPQNAASQRDPVSEQKPCHLETVANIEPLEREHFLSDAANVTVTAFDSDGYSNTAVLPTMNQARGMVQSPPTPMVSVSVLSTEETTFSLVPVSPTPADPAVTFLKADSNHLQLGVEPPGMGHLTIVVQKQDQALSVQLMTETATDHHLLSAHGDSVRLMLENPAWGEGRLPPGSVAVNVEKSAWSGAGLAGNEESSGRDPQGLSQEASRNDSIGNGPLSSVQIMQVSSQLVDLFA